MRKLRRIIACNFDGGKNQLWITLTFREHITSTVEAYKSFDIFMKRLKRRYSHLLYISVIEPQASGRWHFHVLLKDIVNPVLYIKNKDLSNIWSYGFVKVNRLKSGDNVANYVMAYVSDLEYEFTDEETKKTTKKIEKGARLHLYPKGLRIYRTSRNIERPIERTALKGELLEYYEISQSPSFVKETVHITEQDNEIKYVTEYYNDI